MIVLLAEGKGGGLAEGSVNMLTAAVALVLLQAPPVVAPRVVAPRVVVPRVVSPPTVRIDTGNPPYYRRPGVAARSPTYPRSPRYDRPYTPVEGRPHRLEISQSGDGDHESVSTRFYATRAACEDALRVINDEIRGEADSWRGFLTGSWPSRRSARCVASEDPSRTAGSRMGSNGQYAGRGPYRMRISWETGRIRPPRHEQTRDYATADSCERARMRMLQEQSHRAIATAPAYRPDGTQGASRLIFATIRCEPISNW